MKEVYTEQPILLENIVNNFSDFLDKYFLQYYKETFQ